MKKPIVIVLAILITLKLYGQQDQIIWNDFGVLKSNNNFNIINVGEFEIIDFENSDIIGLSNVTCAQRQQSMSGFRVFCGPTQNIIDGNKKRVICGNSNLDFCAAVPEELFPRD